MRKQDHEIHGYELYSAFKRDPLKDDWFFILPVCIIGALVAMIIFIGADRFIEVMSEFIVGVRAN